MSEIKREFLLGDRVRISAHAVLYAGKSGFVLETRTPGPKGHCVQVSIHERGRYWYAPEELEHAVDGDMKDSPR